MSEPSAQLQELLVRQAQLEGRAREITAEERAAHAEVTAASEALVGLERAAGGGEKKVSATQRRTAEDRLLQARTTAAAPWAERRQAAGLAAEDGRRKVALFVGEHFDVLYAAHAAECEAAAHEVDQAAEALVAAYEHRQAAESAVFNLIGLLGRRVQPGDVARSRADQLVAQAQRLLFEGGEQAPIMLHDPRTPRYAAEVEAVSA